jgi:ABC-type glycerol-3-phosphate transport system permease component
MKFPGKSIRNWLSKKNTRQLIIKIGGGAFIIMGIIVIMPFLWQISTSLKTLEGVHTYPPHWIPEPINWSNFIKGWTYYPFTVYLKNTLLTTLIPLIGIIFVSSLVAFSFSRLRWRGRDVVFVLCLVTMMLPPHVLIIPLFILFRNLKWVDTFYPLTVPWFFVAGPGGAFYIFLLRQFCIHLPSELEDAARIDGCSSLRIWYLITLPLTKPALATVFIFGFLRGWNDFLWPLIYLSSPNNRTLMLGLAYFQQSITGGTGQIIGLSISSMMAVSTLVMLPPLILFLFLQKFFIRGIALTGLKV